MQKLLVNNAIQFITFLIISLGITSFLAFLLTLKQRNRWFYISTSYLNFSKEAAQLLGLLGTILSLYINKDTFLTAKSIKDLSSLFLGAWSTTLIGILVALLSFFLLSLLSVPEEDKNERF